MVMVMMMHHLPCHAMLRSAMLSFATLCYGVLDWARLHHHHQGDDDGDYDDDEEEEEDDVDGDDDG